MMQFCEAKADFSLKVILPVHMGEKKQQGMSRHALAE